MRQTRDQFVAIAWLRWRMLVNGFRRKGGTGELIGRILLFPMLAGLAIGPSIGVGVAAFFFTDGGTLAKIVWLLWGTFVFCQFLNIQLGQPGSTFDPTELIRFPLTARDYVRIRLCFGLLTPANVIAVMMSLSVALGVTIGAPSLWLYAFASLGVFAIANVLFSRMVFAWVDRWLSTRRAREVFTGLIFAFSLGIQWANFTFNPAYNHNKVDHAALARLQFFWGIFHRIEPFVAWLPPEVTANSLIAASRNHAVLAFGLIAACAAWALLFFVVFATRMRKEFLGENLSDAANGVKSSALTTARPKPASVTLAPAISKPETTIGLPPVIFAMLGKELLYVRRNSGILYGLIMPIFLVLVFVSKYASHGNAGWFFPAAAAYTLLAISATSYNSFGLEGTGIQFYFLAPVRLRDVVIAKNLLNFLLAFSEIAITFAIITYVGGVPSVTFAVCTVLWAAATIMLTTMVGNLRSITTPKKIDLQRNMRKQVSQLSALIGMGILMGCAIIAAVPVGLALYFHFTWILIPVFLLLAAVAFFFYERSLRSVEAFALSHRDQLFEELCKAS
jgi:ABC-2 type transport system permease protein